MADNTFFRAGSVALLSMTLSSLPAIAATERQLDSHEHGHAQLNMAISGREVLIELITPAANVIGFEYVPKSEEDKMAVSKGTEQLTRGEQLFTFDSGAECSLLTAEVESALLDDDHGGEHHDGDGHDDHDDDHHDDEKHEDHDDEHHDGDGHEDHDDEHHDGEKHDDHDDDHHDGEGHDDHDDHDDEHEAHSEFHVTWSFSCANPDELGSVQVNLFEAFGGFEELDVSVVGENTQTSVELSPEQTEINL